VQPYRDGCNARVEPGCAHRRVADDAVANTEAYRDLQPRRRADGRRDAARERPLRERARRNRDALRDAQRTAVGWSPRCPDCPAVQVARRRGRGAPGRARPQPCTRRASLSPRWPHAGSPLRQEMAKRAQPRFAAEFVPIDRRAAGRRDARSDITIDGGDCRASRPENGAARGRVVNVCCSPLSSN
jgi:hypothetical protein